MNPNDTSTNQTTTKEIPASKEQRYQLQRQSSKQVNLKQETFNPFTGTNVNWNSINLNYNFPMFNFAPKSKY